MIAVLDASAAVRTAMDPESAFRETLAAADIVVAPELIVAEVCSAFRKYVRARVLTRAHAEESIGRALALVDRLQPMRDLVTAVMDLASQTDSSVYDIFYLALAKRTGATLLTADLALRKAARKMGVSVVEPDTSE